MQSSTYIYFILFYFFFFLLCNARNSAYTTIFTVKQAGKKPCRATVLWYINETFMPLLKRDKIVDAKTYNFDMDLSNIRNHRPYFCKDRVPLELCVCGHPGIAAFFLKSVCATPSPHYWKFVAPPLEMVGLQYIQFTFWWGQNVMQKRVGLMKVKGKKTVFENFFSLNHFQLHYTWTLNIFPLIGVGSGLSFLVFFLEGGVGQIRLGSVIPASTQHLYIHQVLFLKILNTHLSHHLGDGFSKSPVYLTY